MTLWPWNPKMLENVPHFHPGQKVFILTLHTHRQSLHWPLISILTSQPIHKMCSSPSKTSYMFSIYEKTINCKTSWKVSFALYWPLISILTSQPIHKMCSSPSKTSYMFSIYEKTVNCKTSWKVSFGGYRGPLLISIDIGPMSLTLHAVNEQFVFQPKNDQLLEWP